MPPGKKQVCCECGEEYIVGGNRAGALGSKFLPINNFIFGNGYLPICNYCIEERVKKVYDESDGTYWNFADQLCQLLNIKFDPSLWEKLAKTHKYQTFIAYANFMRDSEYETIDWKEMNERYLAAAREKELDEEIPELRNEKVRLLQEKWGVNYPEEELVYLENLLMGIMKSQDVNGALSLDQAQKLCKISLLIEQRLREGGDVDKLLGSYEKLTKIADFTPKNAKDVNDFNSVGELFAWLEKRGWINKYYDNVTQDIVDATMKNMQTYVRNLYVNETSISEEIDRRLEALKLVENFENKYYDDDKVDDYDEYELDGYNEAQEFKAEY